MGTVDSRAKLIELTAWAVMLSLHEDDEERAGGENGQGGGVEGVCMSIASKTHWHETQNMSWQLQPLILNNRIGPPTSSRPEWQMVWDIAVIKALKLWQSDPPSVRRLHWSERVQQAQPRHLTPYPRDLIIESERWWRAWEEQLELLMKPSVWYSLSVHISLAGNVLYSDLYRWCLADYGGGERFSSLRPSMVFLLCLVLWLIMEWSHSSWVAPLQIWQ